jgi:hypothetical protein
MSKSETRTATLKTLWGDIKHPTTRYRCHTCSSSQSVWSDPSLDSSDCSPLVLARMQEFALHVPYRIASGFMDSWGVRISKSEVGSLSRTLETTSTRLATAKLEVLATQTLARVVKSTVTNETRASRTWMLEVDGSLVPTRVFDEAGVARVEYREVKTAVLYQKNRPSERYQLSVLVGVERFTILLLGLLRFAGVSQTDCLVGLSDGAVWIANVFNDAMVNYHILDVFHASSYFEILLVGLGWDEAKRKEERNCLLRGGLDVQLWLNRNVSLSVSQSFNDETRKALSYLEKQSELLHTAYPRFKGLGFEVIGSGEIEGANKSVIGSRLKVSGAQWSESGANAKSFNRGMWSSARNIVAFEDARFEAFPRVA